MRKVLALATLLTMLVAWPAAAQETTGSIEGVVRDPAGAVLTGATVELAGPAGRLVTVTDERGEYRFPRLPSGRYTVTGHAVGLRDRRDRPRSTSRSAAPSRPSSPSALAAITEDGHRQSASRSRSTSPRPRRPPTSRASGSSCIPRGRDFTDVVAQAAGAKARVAGGRDLDRRLLGLGEPLHHRRHRHHQPAGGHQRRAAARRLPRGGPGQVGRLRGRVRRLDRRRHQRHHQERHQ